MENQRERADNEQEDRISDLPDHIIHHILSLLFSTKDAVRTGILSKRWKNQWTRVPVLSFNSYKSGTSSENFLQFIDDTLIVYDCFKIKIFFLMYHSKTKCPQISSKIIRFATTRAVEDLCLCLDQEYKLPIFLFKHASLVTLRISNCSFTPNGKVNWECLTILVMASCRFNNQVMDFILSGSPLLKTLIFGGCFGFKKLVIASKSLENLSPDNIRQKFDIEISYPKLEIMKLEECLNVRTAKLLNLPSSLWVTIDFNHHEDTCKKSRMRLIKDILNQLRHVEGLIIGRWFMEYMSAVQAGGQFSPQFNIKYLNLKSHNISVIALLLRNSPLLEALHIDVKLYDQDNRDFGENYWSDATIFNGVLSHLEYITIIGYPRKDGKRKVMFNFVQFFLKNATVLKKIIVKLLKEDGKDFPPKDVSEELLSFPRCSQSAVIQFVEDEN